MIKFIAGDGRRARSERSPRGEGAKDAGADGDKTSVKDCAVRPRIARGEDVAGGAWEERDWGRGGRRSLEGEEKKEWEGEKEREKKREKRRERE